MSNSLIFIYAAAGDTPATEVQSILEKEAKLICEGRVIGSLFMADDKPALVNDAGGYVYGKLYETEEETIFDQMDEHYRCGQGSKKPNSFRRALVRVEKQTGGKDTAWAYLYSFPTEGLARL